MDISNQLGRIVTGIVEDIEARVNADIAETLEQKIVEKIVNFDFNAALTERSHEAIERKIAAFPIDRLALERDVKANFENAINAIVESTRQQLQTRIDDVIRSEVTALNIQPIVENIVGDFVLRAQFPNKSIRAGAINFSNFKLSGDHIDGGIITKFSSQGIDDRASQCQLTIMDTAVVIEQPIVSTGLDVRGNLRGVDAVLENLAVAGDVSIGGNINPHSDGVKNLINSIRQSTLSEILSRGLSAPSINYDEQLLLNTRELGPGILKSNLRKVGTLEGLQTRGETLLDDTLYVRGKKVGINTLEPSSALEVWDEETELTFYKKSQNRGFLGTSRPNQAMTLGVGGQENISLEADGSVTINDLRLGALPISTASGTPNWSGRSGEIVFNDSPQIGQPIGWVCLQGHRWAKFGLITE